MMIDKLKAFAKNKNNLIVVILVGVLLMVISLPVKEEESVPDTNNNDSYEMDEAGSYTTNIEAEDYVEQMEKKVSALLSHMAGAGSVEVIITLESSTEKIVEKDMPVVRSNTTEEDSEGGTRNVSTMDSGETTVYSSEGSSTDPFVVKTISPKVEGVLVLAEGAGTGTVSRDLTDAVQVLFGIEAHQVKVVKKAASDA